MSDQNNSSGHDRWNEEVDSLSPRSRDLVIKDLYGKGQTIVVEDEPGFIGNKINQLDAMLEQVSHEDKTAFLEACKRSPESQSSKSLRLKFLRADKFDAGLAAHRLTQYLDFKRRWFGDEFLDKSITIGDLNEFDLQTLKRGGIQILSKQDEGGRYILFYRNADLVFQSAQNVFRAVWYLINAISEDENAQKRGLVWIIYGIGTKNKAYDSINKKLLLQVGAFIRFGAPIRIVGLHFAYDAPILKEEAQLLASSLSRDVRLRFVAHHNVTHQEFMRELAKYGICKTSIPVTDGTLHLEWLDQRRKVEGSIEQGEDEATRLVSDSAETSSSSSSLQRDLGVTASDGTSAAGGISAGIQYPISANPGAAALTNSNLLATLASSHALPIQMAFCLMPNFQVPPQQGSSSNLVPNQILLGMLSNHLNPYSSLASTNQGQLQVGQSGSIESLSAASLPSWLTGQRTSGNMAGDISAADVTYSAATRPHHKGATPNAPVKLLTVLYRDSDAGSLSDYQCFLRQQIEMFEASSDDVQYNASRMNRNIVLGQVGIRCRHCAKSSEWERAGGAVYYPGNLSMLYQAGQNMAKNHLCNLCKKIPQGTRDLLNLLRRDKRRAAAGKEYWSKTAKAFGVFENEKNGLKLMKKGNHLG